MPGRGGEREEEGGFEEDEKNKGREGLKDGSRLHRWLHACPEGKSLGWAKGAHQHLPTVQQDPDSLS